MNKKGKDLYDEVKEKIEQLNDKDSVYSKFGDIWKIASLGKYRSFDLRYLYEDTSREFVEEHKEQLTKMREDFIENIEEYVEKCINVMRKTNKFKVYYAKTNEEAQNIFMEELGDNKTLYK
ncbi:unnamed protein product, partial [marine sediment metagenome]